MNKKTRLLGVVLCGGQSSRMGTDKSTLLHASGKTFLQHSAERLTSVCDDVVVSTDQPAPNFQVVLDATAQRGPVVGVASALGYAETHEFDACFVTPVDMPDLSVDDLTAVKQQWQSQPRRLVCAVSEADARIQPLVAIYPVTFLDALIELSRSEHRSLSRWIEARPHTKVTLSTASCRNVNSPDDL